MRALAGARCKVPRGRWASCAPQLLPRRSAGPRPAEPEPPRSVPGSSLAGPGSVCCAGRVERGAPTGWRAQTPWVLAPGGFQPPPPPSVPGCLRLLRNRTNETTNPWPHPRKRHTDIPSLLTFLGPSQTSVHRWAEGRDRVLTSWGRGVSGAGFCLRCRLWLLPGARNLAGLSPDPIPHCSEFRSPAPNSELAAGPPCCPDGLEELDKAAVL